MPPTLPTTAGKDTGPGKTTAATKPPPTELPNDDLESDPAPKTPPGLAEPKRPGDKLRIVCIGAHPDDPETGAGGTLARYAEAGHIVNVLYMTRGERGIAGKSTKEAGAIREAEAIAACKELGVTANFFGGPAGSLAFDNATAKALVDRLDKMGVDLLFGQWPIDTDRDHQATAMLTVHAYLAKPRRYPLYLYEVESGTQSLGFTPHAYVEIAPVLQKKLAAIRQHKSQDAERRLYERHHEPMERFRAREIAGTAAEAFAVLSPEAAMSTLPGL